MVWKQPNYSQCVPAVVVSNVSRAIDFYTKAFGFQYIEEESISEENADIQHAALRLGEFTIMLTPEGAFDMPHKTPKSMGMPSPMSLYVYTQNVDQLYKKAVAGGAKSSQAPEDSFWGDRFCKLEDPDGYEWMFATYKESFNQA